MEDIQVTNDSKIQLAKLPHINNIPDDGRAIYSAPYYDYKENKFFWKITDWDTMGIELKPIESIYFKKEIDNIMSDLEFDLAHTLLNYFPYENIIGNFQYLMRDILNIGYLFENYFLILRNSDKKTGISNCRLIEKDLEFLFFNFRSYCDEIQTILKHIHYDQKGITMKESFNGSYNLNKIHRYELPSDIIDYFTKWKGFFKHMRGIRNRIKRGKSLTYLLYFSDGFAYDINIKELSYIYKPKLMRCNNLVSILPVMSHIARNMIQMSIDFSNSLTSSYNLPETKIYGDYKVFLRGTYSNHLLSLDKYIEHEWVEL